MGVPTLLLLLEPNVVWRHAAASHVSRHRQPVQRARTQQQRQAKQQQTRMHLVHCMYMQLFAALALLSSTTAVEQQLCSCQP
jgi:hypothetical protein